jgi:hypothetical protein
MSGQDMAEPDYEIEWRMLREICPVEAGGLVRCLEKHAVTEQAFAEWMSRWRPTGDNLKCAMVTIGTVDDDRQNKRSAFNLLIAAATDLHHAWTMLQKSFEIATSVGKGHLTLDVGYDDAGDELDGNDEESRVKYLVHGIYRLSAAGRRFSERLSLMDDSE